MSVYWPLGHSAPQNKAFPAIQLQRTCLQAYFAETAGPPAMLPLSDDGMSITDSNHTDETKAAAGQIRRSPAGRGCDNRPWTGAVSDWCFPGKMILSDLFSDSRYAASKSHPRCTPFPVCMTMSSPAVRDFRGICRLLPFVLPDNLFGLLCRCSCIIELNKK